MQNNADRNSKTIPVKQSRYGLQGDEREEHKNCISDKTQGVGKLPHRRECEFSVTSMWYVYHRNSKIKTNKTHLRFFSTRGYSHFLALRLRV